MYQYLKSKGYDDNVLKEMHIFYVNEKDGMTDMFWNRAIFPIMDVNHRIIAFGGRVMGQGEPKYLNSPESMVFEKGRNLYGLNHARTARAGNIILCEGYMDCISLHQAGFSQAVASLGTALTPGQINLLKRYTENVYISYDCDGAGRNAALRAIPLLRNAGITAKVVNMEPYKDPDEFIKALGADEYQKRLDEAENSFYFEVRMATEGYDIKDPDGKTKFTKKIASMLLAFENPVERDNYLDGICDQYRINPDSMKKLMATMAAKGEGIPKYERPKSGVHSVKKDSEDGIKKSQKLLLTWLCDEPSIYKIIGKYLEPDDFSEEMYQTVAGLLFEQLKEGEINPAKIIGCFTDSEEQSEVGSLFTTKLERIETAAEKERALKDVLIKVKSFSYERQAKSGDSTDMASLNRIIENKKQLQELKNLKIVLKDEEE